MNGYVLDFQQIDKSSLPLVGGKGANLGEMTRAGFPVPPGFCVTTEAYRAFIGQSARMEDYFARLAAVTADQLDEIAALGREIRDYLVTIEIPGGIRQALVDSWRRSGESKAYAVRSSATAEDLPTASFAGQQDTYLNVRGEEQLLQAVRRCWASLFTDRAISYRAKNGFDHRAVLLSVVVQQMVFPEVSGILFTADPISGHRGTVSIDASFGLGEALVSGLVSADLYQVRSGRIIEKKIARKKLAIYSLPEGGTETRDLPESMQERQALSDELIVELARLGGTIKRHYGSDQDIEWCWAEGKLFIVQSRPITSLYPLPDVPVAEGESPHILISFGHQQMMTDAIKPMGLSVLRTMVPFGKRSVRTESDKAYVAGGRMFIDITQAFTLKPARRVLPKVLSNIDERIASGIEEFIRKDSFVRGLPPQPGMKKELLRFFVPIAGKAASNLFFAVPERAAKEANEWMETFVHEGMVRLSGVTGSQRILRIQELAGIILRTLFARMIGYPLSGIIASIWIKKLAAKWLGDTEIMPVLNKSLHGNVTSELGLMIGDLADAARDKPQVVELIRHGDPVHFRSQLQTVEGGAAFLQEWDRFMELYGMRCPGEIDMTRKRWREDASTLLPSIDNHMRTMKPGEHRERFAEGAREAEAAARELVDRVRALPFGWLRAKLLSRLVRVYRSMMGLREHPKYMMIRLFGFIRQAMQEETRRLVEAGVLQSEEDVFYLTLDELMQLTEGQPMPGLAEMLEERKRDYSRFQSLTPPRVMTSEGEIITGRRRQQDAPAGALLGTPVSAGVVEGIARVVLRPDEAKLNKGEIMIAPFTDPGWTPLFHSAVGLVMEVGGLMTHGAVVAREYGLPAVVGIDDATKRIKDGDRIRLDGTRGYVLILEKPEPS
ncbi:phosphoenolpyruvate synthase [Paenibacillus sp. H1-7]|uniref:phosphoenolpyruvate synthase n=1 Tax=Paenibacillus sp. H1-7 TaxID=2282849 RepID=UPI001EF8E686|nr:phosphoenolpyruvate synthase [Paenibacillus sp. H1-7]ULL13084.1 phosphoenolpyruvate synthase [Paenibacillus sp. H1-7]